MMRKRIVLTSAMILLMLVSTVSVTCTMADQTDGYETGQCSEHDWKYKGHDQLGGDLSLFVCDTCGTERYGREVNGAPEGWVEKDGFIMTADEKIIVGTVSKSMQVAMIPETVETIYHHSMIDMNIDLLYILKNVKEIGNVAFFGSTVDQIIIEGQPTIGLYAFGLKNVFCTVKTMYDIKLEPYANSTNIFEYAPFQWTHDEPPETNDEGFNQRIVVAIIGLLCICAYGALIVTGHRRNDL